MDKEQFKDTLAQADKELDLGLDLSDLQVHDIFLTKLHHISTRHRALDIIQAIQNKTPKLLNFRNERHPNSVDHHHTGQPNADEHAIIG